MAVADPFASAPVDEAQTEAPAPEPQQEATVQVVEKKPAATSDDGKHVVTLKGGSGFDAPWYVIHASGVDELEQLFSTDAPRLAALFERIQKAAQHFVEKGGSKPSGGSNSNAGGGNAGAAPKAAQEAPGGEKRFCEHGEMRFRSGTSKAGKAYSGFFCASGDRNNECRAQFLR